MKEDKLKKYMEENRSSFDDLEAPVGLFDKIASALPEEDLKTSTTTKVINWNWIVSIAASIVVTFGLTVFFMGNDQDVNSLAIASNESNEIHEIESYYGTQVEDKMNKINVILAHNTEEKKEILMDVQEIDSLYVDLKKELNEGIDNEEIVQAMIQHYQVKLKMLEDVLFYLEQYEETKEKEESYEL